jgi:radical SAM superfamily enzyme YgiQ (UPF0313 family)
MDPDGYTNALSRNVMSTDPPSKKDFFVNDLTGVDTPQYSSDKEEYLTSIQNAAFELFAPGKVYNNISTLRDELRHFGNKKGFVVTTDGCKLRCNKCSEPISQKIKERGKMPLFQSQ